MRFQAKCVLAVAAFATVLNVAGYGQGLSAEMKTKLDDRIKAVSAWAAAPEIVAAVKAANTSTGAEAAAMTQDKWKTLTVLDPFVRSFGKNPAGVYLKSNKAPWETEAFVSAKNGCKVAFLSKPTSWSHAGKDKHDVPMKGKTWIGGVEVDESSGAQQVQVAVPVLDAGRPIGSLVVGVNAASLKQ